MILRSTLASALLLWASAAAAQDDPCTFDGTFGELITHASEQASPVGEAAAQETAAADQVDLKTELMNRANGDGLAGGRVDLLRRAFVALDLGTVTEDGKDLVFNFNPEALALDGIGQFSPRVVIHEKTLFGPLDEEIDTFDEGIRQDRKDALKQGLGDLDDVELKLRWTNQAGTPRAYLQPVVNDIFLQAYKDAAGQEADIAIGLPVARLTQRLSDAFDGREAASLEVEEICARSDTRLDLITTIAGMTSAIQKSVETLRKALREKLFFAVADLIEGQPKLIADGSLRRRVGAAGPNEGTFNLSYQVSSVSYNGAKRFAKDGKLTADSVQKYLAQKGRLTDSIPLFSLTASYTKTNDFRIVIPNVADEFRTPGSHTFTGKVTAGGYFGGGRNRRLDFEATYDDVSGDPAKTDRFISKLSWTEKLNPEIAKIAGGGDFVATFIYANKPEFRGSVDKDFGLRAGLKWSLGGQ